MSNLRPAPGDPGLAPEVQEIPIGVRRAASWSWRLLVIVAAGALLLWGLTRVTTIVIPVLIAILLAALLQPVVKILTRYTFLGRAAASGIAPAEGGGPYSIRRYHHERREQKQRIFL